MNNPFTRSYNRQHTGTVKTRPKENAISLLRARFEMELRMTCELYTNDESIEHGKVYMEISQIERHPSENDYTKIYTVSGYFKLLGTWESNGWDDACTLLDADATEKVLYAVISERDDNFRIFTVGFHEIVQTEEQRNLKIKNVDLDENRY